MSKRERFLAIAVAVVIGLFVVQYVVGKFNKTLADKRAAIENARGKSEDMDKEIITGKIAAKKLNEVAMRSLPSKKELAIAQYRDWLTQLGQDVDMKEIYVSQPETPAATTQAYQAYNFTLRGDVRMDKVFDLMGKYYDKNFIHRVRNLKMDYKEGQTYTVTLDSQAIAMSAASPEQEPSPDPSGRLAMPIEEYKTVILNRNPFAAPNNAPSIDNKSVDVQVGSRLSHRLEHKDKEGHGASYKLVSTDLPEGLRLSGSTLTGRFDEPGKHEVLVEVADDGWPSASREEKIVINVNEKPPEVVEEKKPSFDVATQAFVTGMTKGREGKKVWIRSRTDGKSFTLGEGDEFELGELKAKVLDINLDEDFAQLESNGIRWIVDMDMSLAEAFKRASEDD